MFFHSFCVTGTTPTDVKPKLLSSQQCTKQKVGLGQSLISTLLAAEGSGGYEPDQSPLESLAENPQQAFHMRISLGDEHAATSGNTLGDFYGKLKIKLNTIFLYYNNCFNYDINIFYFILYNLTICK